jgi:ribosomal protein S12 methylthiotransferase
MMNPRQNSKASVGMLSLGCPKTLVDSELVLGFLDRAKYRIANYVTDCDVAILNTCSFVQDAKEESIDYILKLIELKRDGVIQAVVVMGCLVQRYHQELEAELREVDAFVGTGDYQELGRVVDQVFHRKKISMVGNEPGFLYTAEMSRIPLTPQFTRYVKISEGCDHVCAFCTIPKFRGKHRSRSIDDIVKEVHLLVAQGAKELILTGQDTTYFGRDTHQKYLLPELLRQLNSIRGVEWLRLLYAYPSCVTDELIDSIASLNKVCHYLDMPLQHISDSMLQAMRRGTTKKTTYQMIHKLRKRISNLAIRSTFIVGFPGETERDFDELMRFMEDVRFERLGIFMYSQEEESAAGSYPDQVGLTMKKNRFDQSMQLQQEISKENNQRLMGKTMCVLIEGKEKNAYVGRTYQDAPEVDGLAYVNAEEEVNLQPGQFVDVKVTATKEYDISGVLIAQQKTGPYQRALKIQDCFTGSIARRQRSKQAVTAGSTAVYTGKDLSQ